MSFLKWMIHFFLSGSMFLGLIVSCSPVEFNRQTKNCGGLGEQACKVLDDPRFLGFDYPYVAPLPSVDVLVVVDNSVSMRFEHERIGERFNSFLDIVDGLEWRIAVTTMDISNASNYREGDEILNRKSYTNSGYSFMEPFQDGNLVPFSNGQTTLTKGAYSTSEAQRLFEEAIQFDTEAFSAGDERGLFTASLAIGKNQGSWIRSHAHLAIVFITDEDVRGWGTDPINQKEKKFPKERDFANHLKASIDNDLGAAKGVSVYPIIVQSTNTAIPSVENGGTKNQSYIQRCLIDQLNQDRTDAKVGYMYEELFDYFGGTTASICNPNYSTVLQGIADRIDTEARQTVTIPCIPVIDAENGFEFSMTPALDPGTWIRDGQVITFDPALPPGFKIQFKYVCEEI